MYLYVVLTVNRNVHGHLRTPVAACCQASVFSLVPWIRRAHYNESASRECMLFSAHFHHLIIVSITAVTYIFQTQWHLLSIL